MNYKQVRADFETLEGVAELSDQQALDERRVDLMQHPTKAYAASLYESGIYLWFRQHRKEHGISEEVKEIAERYGL